MTAQGRIIYCYKDGESGKKDKAEQPYRIMGSPVITQVGKGNRNLRKESHEKKNQQFLGQHSLF